MNRKDFIKKGLLGTTIFIASKAAGNITNNSIDELHSIDPVFHDQTIGFNHIPNTKSDIMANTIFHKADSRGHANHGWLDSHHTFSFANYYNPERMHFGVLRVLNDDWIAPGMGFGTHPHDNMEIITIPLEGDLEHKDSMGNSEVIKNGDVQVMSAGTGIQHSEYNKNKDIAVQLLQIWMFPNKRNVTPRYDQMTLIKENRINKFQQILSPNADDDGVWVHQDAWFHLGTFDAGQKTTYALKKPGNGIYAFLISGKAKIENQELGKRDALGLWEIEKINIEIEDKSELLLMEVPMELN